MRLAVLLGLGIAVAACGGRDPVADEANNTVGLPTLNEVEASPSGEPPASNAAAPTATTAPAGTIPAALQGRWGLTPRDCTSELGDAKGLLVINSSELRFYESRALPAATVETSADSISGTFDFTGEGQKWSRYEALQARGSTLQRTERNPLATFHYARCE